MNRHFQPRQPRRGFTLLEMSMVILVLLALIGMVSFGGSAVSEWQAGKKASETLRSVYVAQRTYLADHPTTSVDTITRDDLLPYLPTDASTFPQVEDLDGTMRDINVDVSPPVVSDGGDGVYDPSGKDNDSLWDVGE